MCVYIYIYIYAQIRLLSTNHGAYVFIRMIPLVFDQPRYISTYANKKINRSHTHTHTDREENPRHTHIRQEQQPTPPDEHHPQTLTKYANKHGNDVVFYSAVEPDSLIAVFRHFLALLSFGCM